jgi:hypothetical protein
MKKGQVATEFIIFFGFMFLIFVVFIVAVASDYRTLSTDKERLLLSDQAHTIRKEILVAAGVEDGYYREFDIPENLEGTEYTVQIVNNVLVIESANEEFSIKVPPITGTLAKGATNSIENKEGLICVNGAC